jgi:hypothetical protein
MDQVAVFEEVFQNVRFPYFSADLDRLRGAIDQTIGDTPLTHFRARLDVPPPRRAAAMGALVAFLRQVQVPDPIFALFIRSDFLQRTGHSARLLDLALHTGRYKLSGEGDDFIWEEQTLWPVAYSTIVSQFLDIVALNQALIRKRADETGGWLQIISEFPRQMPTHMHYAAASLGAWIGGAINVQYFAFYAAIPQIVNSVLNVRYGESIGYSRDAAQKLDSSGLIALPAALVSRLLEAQGNSSVFGSIGFDEMNTANGPDGSAAVDASGSELNGYFTDKYYRAPFRARPLARYGLYGAHDVRRDHYESFYATLEPSAVVRCKHFCAPVIDVSSIADIRAHVAKIPIHHKDGVFYRGQGQLHLLQRDPAVRAMLFADSCSDEPSLTTSASRDLGYDYDTVHFALKYFIEQAVLNRDPTDDAISRWRGKSRDSLCSLDYALLALSQHYGLPSHGLDITTSDEVAAWFATNRFSKDRHSVARYRGVSAADWPADPRSWPVVIACQTVTHSIQSSLHDCLELSDFGFEARRPIAQKARFFLGGHSDHQNRLAEAVICVFRLRPGNYETACTFESLFPPPSEDPAYRLMLDFATSADFGFIWGKYINRFHDEAPS